MYALQPTAIYVQDRVFANDLATARLDRMLNALGRGREDCTAYGETDLIEVATQLEAPWDRCDYEAPVPAEWTRTAGPDLTGRRGPDGAPCGPSERRCVPAEWTRPLVFVMQHLEGETPDFSELKAQCPEGVRLQTLQTLQGWIRTRGYRSREADQKRNLICWNAWEFGTQWGCPHGCQYCGDGRWGKFMAMGLNLEEYVDRIVGPTLAENPWQKSFRIIGWGADHIAFEPEYGMFELAAAKCAEFGDRYMIFHTKAANVDWLAEMPNRDRVIALWSIAGKRATKIIEPGAASSVERIEAARRCQEMGQSVRMKFKPFVPIKGWREDAAECVANLFERVRPDSIGITVLMWMSAQALRRMIDVDLLDPEFVAAMDEAEEEMTGLESAPFPVHKRVEVYRFMAEEIRKHDKNVKLYVSTEAPDVWDAVGDVLGQDRRAFLCGCGPVALPGGKLGLSEQFHCSTVCHEGFPDPPAEATAQ